MQKIVVCSLVVVALLGGTSARAMAEFFPWWAFDSVIEEVQDRGTLRVGLGLFEPWSACNADGELIGFEIDVATKVAADIGVEVEFARTNWNYIISALIAEEFDVIISGMSILPDRNLRINFTVPYSFGGVYLVAHTANTAALETRDDFNQPSVTIAALRGSSSIPAIRRTFPEATIRLFGSDVEVLRALVAGEVHAGTAFSTTPRTWVAAHPETLHLPFTEPLAEYPAAMAVRKGDLDTLNFFNSWITANTADGWLPRRWQYWFETREWAEQVATDPETVAACEDSFQ